MTDALIFGHRGPLYYDRHCHTVIDADNVAFGRWVSIGVADKVVCAISRAGEASAVLGVLERELGPVPGGRYVAAEEMELVRTKRRATGAWQVADNASTRELARGLTKEEADGLAGNLDTFWRLRNALVAASTTPKAEMTPDTAAAVVEAKRLMDAFLVRDEQSALRHDLRRASPDLPVGTNGFINPYYKSIAVDESWVYPSDSRALPSISVQWLTFQGAEFGIDFPTKEARNAAMRAIFQRYAADEDKAILGKDLWALTREAGLDHNDDGWYAHYSDLERRQTVAKRGEFVRPDLTITPDMLVDLLPPEAMIRFTPTSAKSRQQMLRLGVNLYGIEDMTVPVSEIATLVAAPLLERQPTAPIAPAPIVQSETIPKMLFRCPKFVVTDYGTKGVEVEFCTLDAGGAAKGSKWFMDGAADQMRDFLASGEARKKAMLLEQRLGVSAVPLRR